MITAARIQSARGTVTFTVGTTGSVQAGGYTIKRLDSKYVLTRTEIPKMQSSGQWENKAYVRSLEITFAGDVVGSDAAGYVTNRQAFANVVLPNQGVQAEQVHGTAFVTWAGQAEVFAPFVVTDLDLPTDVDADAPRAASYAVTLTCDYGYWRKVSDSTVLKI